MSLSLSLSLSHHCRNTVTYLNRSLCGWLKYDCCRMFIPPHFCSVHSHPLLWNFLLDAQNAWCALLFGVFAPVALASAVHVPRGAHQERWLHHVLLDDNGWFLIALDVEIPSFSDLVCKSTVGLSQNWHRIVLFFSFQMTTFFQCTP